MTGESKKRFSNAFEPYRAETARLKPYEIKIDPAWNPRVMDSPETLAHIEALKISIKERGILEAVRVTYDRTTGTPTLVYGQCRVTAARQLWDEGIEVMVPAEQAKGDEAELTLQNLVSNSGQPLRQDEIGVSCKRLLNYGKTVEQIATHIAKPVRYVTDAITLVDAPIEAKRMIADGLVTAPHVLHELGHHGFDGGMTRLREAVAAKPHPARPLPRPKAPNASQIALAAADQLARYIQGNNEMKWSELQRLAGEYLALRNKPG